MTDPDPRARMQELQHEHDAVGAARVEVEVARLLLSARTPNRTLWNRIRVLVANLQPAVAEPDNGAGATGPGAEAGRLDRPAVEAIVEAERVRSTFRPESLPARTRLDNLEALRVWAAPILEGHDSSRHPVIGRIVTDALELRAQLDPDGAIEDQREEIASTPIGHRFRRSFDHFQLARMLRERGRPDDLRQAAVLNADIAKDRSDLYGEEHPYTLVAEAAKVLDAVAVLNRLDGEGPVLWPHLPHGFHGSEDLVRSAERILQIRIRIFGSRSARVALAHATLAQVHRAAQRRYRAELDQLGSEPTRRRSGLLRQRAGHLIRQEASARAAIEAMPDPPPSASRETLGIAHALLADALVGRLDQHGARIRAQAARGMEIEKAEQTLIVVLAKAADDAAHAVHTWIERREGPWLEMADEAKQWIVQHTR